MSNAPILLIEVFLVLGSVLGIGFWQLWSLRRDEEREQPDEEVTDPDEDYDDDSSSTRGT